MPHYYFNKTIFFCLFFCFATHHLAWGQSVAWEVTGQTNYGISPLPPIISNPNLTTVGLTRGAGVTTTGTAAGDAWGGNGFDAIDQSAAIANQSFVTFTISPNAGFTLNLISISTYNIRRSDTGPTTGIWQYSVNSTDFIDIGTAITWGANTTGTGNAQAAIDLSGIAALQGVAETTTVTFRIVNWGATAAGGTWYINNLTGNDLEINGAVVPVGGTPSNATDAFRSRQSGNWNSPDTWESFTGGTWIPATLIPNSTADIITILPTHIVNVTADITIDQTVIAPGGVINYTGGTITLNDGAGDDLIIQGDEATGVGGIFNHNGGNAMNVPAGTTVRIQTAGVLQVTSNTGGIGDAYAGNASNGKFIYEDAAVFNWNTTLTFTSSGQTYFPNAGTAVPIFLITQNVGSIGANDPTTFNGLFVLNNGSISFQNAGLKTFRNGITGIGTVTRVNGSGRFQIGDVVQTSTLGANIDLNNNPMVADANATLTQIGATVLSNDLTLSNGTLVLNGGINLNGRNINLGTTGRIQEDRANNFVITDLTAIDDNTQGGAINFEASITAATEEINGTGLYLRRTAGADYTVTVARRHYQADGLGIKKVYDITGVATGTNTTMRIAYAPSEITGLTPEELIIFRRKNNQWTRAEEDNSGFENGTNMLNNYVEAININEFSEWTAGDGSTSLPINLLSFEAMREGEQVRLAWRTASEQDNQGFHLEMNLEGQDFEPIAFVEGKGNSLELQSYEFTHTQSQAAYYRLKQLDIDGGFTYSEAVFVPDYAQRIHLYPNPVRGQVYLSGLDKTAQTSFTLYNAEGQLILQTQAQGNQSEEVLTRALQRLSAGVYLLAVENAQKVQQLKVVIE